MTQSPATLVAIIVAARKAGDRDLERETKRELESQHGVKLSFSRDTPNRRSPTREGTPA